MPADPRRNILEQQQANRRTTVLVMMLFVAFVGLLGLGFDVFVLGWGEPGRHAIEHVPFAALLAVGFGSWSAFWSLEAGASSVLRSSGAAAVAAGDERYQRLMNVVEEMAIASGQPVPAVYVIPDPDPNAFATGKDPGHAALAVTQGLLDRLSRDELQAVIAHEMSHVRNMDIRLMTVVAALVGAVMLLSEFGMRSMRFGAVTTGSRRSGSSRRNEGGGIVFLIFWVIALVLAPLISRMLAMAVSRQREYLADASGAELTRNPEALAMALEKIDAATDPTRSIKRGTAHLCIADPLGAAANEREGWLADLFATHPPIRKRISALHRMAYLNAPPATDRPTPLPES